LIDEAGYSPNGTVCAHTRRLVFRWLAQDSGIASRHHGFVHGDGELALYAASGQMLDGLGGAIERVDRVKGGLDRAALDELSEAFEVRLSLAVDDEGESLSHEWGQESST
jgi:hypothetical protein